MNLKSELIEAITKILSIENKELNELTRLQFERILFKLKASHSMKKVLKLALKSLQILTDIKQIATFKKRRNLFYKITTWFAAIFSRIYIH